MESGSGQAAGRQARRDPAGRRRAIVAAAAALIVQDGTELTHRRAAERAAVPLGATTYYFSSLEELREAALEHLAERIEADLREIAGLLADGAPLRGGDAPERVAAALHAYLTDRARVDVDAALYAAAMQRPALRPVALRWFDGLVEVLSPHVGTDAARALAVLADGAAVHAILHDRPLDRDFLTRTISALLRGPSTGGMSGR